MRDLSNIISELETHKAAIEKALTALRGMTGTQAPKRRGRPPGKRAATAPANPPAKRGQLPKKQSRITEEGRQRLRRAMKKRWAAKRAAGQGKKAVAKRR